MKFLYNNWDHIYRKHKLEIFIFLKTFCFNLLPTIYTPQAESRLQDQLQYDIEIYKTCKYLQLNCVIKTSKMGQRVYNSHRKILFLTDMYIIYYVYVRPKRSFPLWYITLNFWITIFCRKMPKRLPSLTTDLWNVK